MKHDLQALKEQLTIPEVWQRLGLSGKAAPSCRSPFRPDRSPSFSIYENGRRWMDFATGEGGDAIDFIARACSIETQEATRRFLAMAGAAAPCEFPSAAPRHRDTSHHRVTLPPLRRGTLEEIESVARSRHLSPAAVSLAQSLGTLAFGEVCGFPCWVLLDAARRIAEARRMDRLPFPAVGELGERKAHTLRGSCKSWPVGVAVLKTLPHFRAAMLVEGGPDYLAALHFCLQSDAHDALPLAMLGRNAGTRLAPEALALLKGRRVRLYPHADADGGGVKAAQTWAAQLCQHGCQAEFFSLQGITQTDGQPVNDLNDAVHATRPGLLAALLP